MRIQRILVGAALLMLCAAAAYAQVSISSTPLPQVIASGQAEIAGAVRVMAQNPTVADTFTVTFTMPVANTASGTYAVVIVPGTWDSAPSIASIVSNVITLNVPATGTAGQWFELRNVRINVSGLAAPASVTASLGALQNTVVAGETTAIVISNIGAGLSAAATNAEAAIILSNGRDIEDWTEWILTEGFAGAWKSDPQATYDLNPNVLTNSATNGTDITLTMSGLPNGVYVDTYVDGNWLGEFADTTTQLVITFSDRNMALVETLDVDFYVDVNTGEATLPLASATYKVYATLSPNSGTKYPKFATINLPTAGYPVFSVVPNTTNFILPYLTTFGGTYNTGIAIANTTKDPYGADGAMAQDGTVTVNFYGNDGTTVTYNSATDAVVGNGLTSAGVLKAGYTWTVLASELLAAKGRTTPLTGYAIIILNATNGHGMSYVSNFAGFTAGAGLLVIDAPVTSRFGRSSYRTEETTF